MTTSHFDPVESAEFVGGPWDGQRVDAVDGDPLPLVMVVPSGTQRHSYILARIWYGGECVEVLGYEYAGVYRNADKN